MFCKALISLELAYTYVLVFKYLSYHYKKQTGGSHTIASTGDMLASGFGRIKQLQDYSICKLEKPSGLCSDCHSAINSSMSQLSWKHELPGRLIRLHAVPYFKQMAGKMMKLGDC